MAAFTMTGARIGLTSAKIVPRGPQTQESSNESAQPLGCHGCRLSVVWVLRVSV